MEINKKEEEEDKEEDKEEGEEEGEEIEHGDEDEWPLLRTLAYI